jgi:Rrf2 family protein
MRVSARADYALRAALELAAAPGGRVSGEQLAYAQNIPGKFIETILIHLRRSGLVRCQRGPDGGFWLARPASETSLADIIRAVDARFPDAPGEPPDDATYAGPAEPLRRVWIALRAFGPSVLETLTLADIVSGELWLPGGPKAGSTAWRVGFTRRGPRSGTTTGCLDDPQCHRNSSHPPGPARTRATLVAGQRSQPKPASPMSLIVLDRIVIVS